MIAVKFRKNLAYIVHDELWQLAIMILVDKAEEFAVSVMNDIADLLLKGKWCELL